MSDYGFLSLSHSCCRPVWSSSTLVEVKTPAALMLYRTTLLLDQGFFGLWPSSGLGSCVQGRGGDLSSILWRRGRRLPIQTPCFSELTGEVYNLIFTRQTPLTSRQVLPLLMNPLCHLILTDSLTASLAERNVAWSVWVVKSFFFFFFSSFTCPEVW